MPEAFIIRRWDAEISGLKAEWLKARTAMSAKERKRADKIVEQNIFEENEIRKLPARMAAYLSYYLIQREDIPRVSDEDKIAYINKFEASCATQVSDMCKELLSKC
jgi:hypothetical protein